MKKVVQLTLFLILIIITIIFYKIYFSDKKENQKIEAIINKNQNSQNNIDSKNNLIKNLKYEIKLNTENQYIITSDLSEISYENNVEIVNMQNVTAIFIDESNIPIVITSDQAIYNNSNYDTKFSQNVKIEYLENIILSDKLNLNFKNNLITVSQNVKYTGIQGTITADNVKIDLITKNIEIYMDNTKDNVEITTN